MDFLSHNLGGGESSLFLSTAPSTRIWLLAKGDVEPDQMEESVCVHICARGRVKEMKFLSTKP